MSDAGPSPQPSSKLAAWLLPVLLVAGLLVWLLATDPNAEAPSTEAPSESEKADPNFSYDVR